MDIVALMKQASELKKNYEQAQAEMEKMTVQGTAGGGVVMAEVNGLGQIKRVKLEATIVKNDDIEMLEDLIVVAVADAQKKAMTEVQTRMGNLAGGMNLPFKLPF
jgi:DNA-binding YbaB/EbfC family protein